MPGVNGFIVSNHGGRAVDYAPSLIEVLPEIVDACGDRAEVYLDSGIRRGSDIVKAVALGAKAVLIGRPYVYGLGAAGEHGVDHVFRILTDEIDRCPALIGIPKLSEVTRCGPPHGPDAAARRAPGRPRARSGGWGEVFPVCIMRPRAAHHGGSFMEDREQRRDWVVKRHLSAEALKEYVARLEIARAQVIAITEHQDGVFTLIFEPTDEQQTHLEAEEGQVAEIPTPPVRRAGHAGPGARRRGGRGRRGHSRGPADRPTPMAPPTEPSPSEHPERCRSWPQTCPASSPSPTSTSTAACSPTE